MTRLVSISEIADVFNGKTPAKGEHRTEGFPVLKIKDVDESGRFRGDCQSFVDRSLAEKFRQKWIEQDDILILNAAHNASYVASKSFFAGPEVRGLLPTGEWLLIRTTARDVLPCYVNHWIRTADARQAIRFIVKGIHLYPKDVAKLQIPLPPLDEQRRIVGLLDRAAEIRRRADAARAKARAIIPALFLDTFGDPATNPKGWPVVEMGDLVGRIDGGWSPTCGAGTPANDEWGVLKLSAVKSGGFDANEAKPLPNQADARPELSVRDGDLLFTRKNTLDLVGTAAVVTGSPRRRMLPDTVFRLMPAGPASFRPEYLCTLINLASFRPVIRQLASGSAASMPGISKGRLLKLRVPIPPMVLQVTFAERVERLQALGRHLDGAAAKAEAMAAGLSAEVFG